MNTEEWTLVFTGLGAGAAIVGVVGIFLAARALKFNAWIKAQEIYVNKDFYKARKDILSHFGFTNAVPSRIGQTDEDSAIHVCQKMDELARLKPYLGTKRIIEAWGIPMGKSWMILLATVNQERKTHKAKWDAFQRLAKVAIKKHKLEDLNRELAP